MKKIILFVIFLAILAFSTVYTFRSGLLFFDGIKGFQEKQNVAAGLSFVELVSKYPYSPFVAVSRVYTIWKDPANIVVMDAFFLTKSKKEVFQIFTGRSPAYYDPFFWASLAYYLIVSILAVLQRYWAGALGLSLKGLMSRDTFAVFLGLAYSIWVRGVYATDSAVYKLAGSVSEGLVTPFGASIVTLGFSGFMILVNIVVTIMALFTFLGKANKGK